MPDKDKPVSKLFLWAFSAVASVYYLLAAKEVHDGREPAKMAVDGSSFAEHPGIEGAEEPSPPHPSKPLKEPSAPGGTPRRRQHLDTSSGKHAGVDAREHMTIPAGVGFQPEESREEKLAQGWQSPQPEGLSKPTYWPASLAFGITVLAWGPVTSWIVAAVGFVICVISLAGWIGDLRYER